MGERLAGKRAIVTGAGRGIGAAIARAFIAQGAAVCIAERDAEAGEAMAQALRAEGGRAVAVPCDVAVPEEVEAAASAAAAALGPIDVLVNNAGMNVFRDPLAMAHVDWRMCLAVDLEGAWHFSRAVLPGMLEGGGGAIVNIASTHSFKIIPGCFPYPVAKHGLIGLTRALGIEYAPRNIRVNAIAPGYIETQIAIDYWNEFPDPAAERRKAELLHPPRRIGRPEEVAMTAVFLASDEAPFINATCIMVDGGRSAVYHD